MIAPPKGLTLEALSEWIEAKHARLFESRDGAWHCRTCKSLAQGQVCAISLHAIELTGCAGYGRVKYIALSRCPNCEPDAPGWVSTCVHVPLIDIMMMRRTGGDV